jgi:Flp pilus assembly pilin Flp
MVEYALILVAVAIPCLMGCMVGGAHLYKNYVEARNTVLETLP